MGAWAPPEELFSVSSHLDLRVKGTDMMLGNTASHSIRQEIKRLWVQESKLVSLGNKTEKNKTN